MEVSLLLAQLSGISCLGISLPHFPKRLETVLHDCASVLSGSQHLWRDSHEMTLYKSVIAIAFRIPSDHSNLIFNLIAVILKNLAFRRRNLKSSPTPWPNASSRTTWRGRNGVSISSRSVVPATTSRCRCSHVCLRCSTTRRRTSASGKCTCTERTQEGAPRNADGRCRCRKAGRRPRRLWPVRVWRQVAVALAWAPFRKIPLQRHQMLKVKLVLHLAPRLLTVE